MPLTGKVADEAIWRMIAEIARSAGSTVRLLYVRGPSPGANLPRAAGPERRGLEAEGSRYLDAVTASLADIPVEQVIRFGDLEGVILDEAATWRADLVALTAGDRTWLSRAVRTGAAATAFRTRGMPALLYTPTG